MGTLVRGVIGSLGMLAALTSAAVGKAPEAPTVPATEFKVLAPAAQEFFQAETAAVGGYVSVTEWLSTPAASVLKHAALGIVGSLSAVLTCETSYGLARAVYAMAEEHWRAGDRDESRRWYIGLRELFPGSAFADLAAERLERLHASTGPTLGERLIVRPRLARP
jgi:hypothetical protein